MTEANPDPAERKRQLAREAQRRYRAKNGNKIRERQRQYREANRDEIRAYGREYSRQQRGTRREDPSWQARQSEYQRSYRQANGEKLQEQNRQYYKSNRKTLLEKRREYNEANRDKRREYQRRYMAENGHAVRERDRQRWRDNRELNRERRRARVHGLTADQWAAMWAAQDGCCYLCRCPMELDEAIVEHWHGCAVPHNSGESCHRCRRGLAHYLCNNIIGAAADDPAVLRVIADNLERANADVAARQAVIPQHITLF